MAQPEDSAVDETCQRIGLSSVGYAYVVEGRGMSSLAPDCQHGVSRSQGRGGGQQAQTNKHQQDDYSCLCESQEANPSCSTKWIPFPSQLELSAY